MLTPQVISKTEGSSSPILAKVLLKELYNFVRYIKGEIMSGTKTTKITTSIAALLLLGGLGLMLGLPERNFRTPSINCSINPGDQSLKGDKNLFSFAHK